MRIGKYAVLIAGLTLTACNEHENELDGKWPSMKWSHPKYETVKVDGISYYLVPVEGGDFGFRCKNYQCPWLTDHVFEANGYVWHSSFESYHDDSNGHHYETEWCKIDAVDDSVKVHFDPNDGLVRKAEIGITAGDIFDSFKFLQATAYYTDSEKR